MPSTAIDPLRTIDGASAGGNSMVSHHESAFAPDLVDAAGGVDVSLDEMSAEPRIDPQRSLEVHQRAAAQRAHRGHTRRLRRNVREHAVAVAGDHS